MGELVNNRVLRWFGTAASLVISVGVAALVIAYIPNAGISLADGLWFVVRGTGEMMLYLLPLWAADVVVHVVPAATRRLRLIFGAIGLGVGVAVIVGLAAARDAEAPLVTFACIYLALSAYNCWLSSRQSTGEIQGT